MNICLVLSLGVPTKSVLSLNTNALQLKVNSAALKVKDAATITLVQAIARRMIPSRITATTGTAMAILTATSLMKTQERCLRLSVVHLDRRQDALILISRRLLDTARLLRLVWKADVITQVPAPLLSSRYSIPNTRVIAASPLSLFQERVPYNALTS